MRLYEVADCLTAPGENALWFMYQPLLMSKKSFEKLDKKQQDVLVAAGKKAQAYFESKADGINKEAIKAFQDHNSKVVSLSDDDYQAWLDVAKKSSYAQFAKDVPNGQKLIDEALAVK
jgi:TRAP-type transport system periplasmic protein